MARPRIMYYHDGRHPLIYMYEPPMLKEEYEAAIDELAGTPVEAVTFCLGEGRVFLHDTKAGEFWGHNIPKWPKISRQRTHMNAKALIEAGHDPLRIVCDRAHEKGMLLYPSLILQQASDTRRPLESHEDYLAALADGSNSYLFERCSDFRFENKHLEIGAKGDLDPSFPCPGNLDFMHEESRNERFAIIEEVLHNYPVDGFQLQLQSSCYFFRPDQVDEGRPIFTEWIRKVHDEVKKSGADRELVIRIPLDLDHCESVGMDLKTWVREEFVDVIIGHDAEAKFQLNPNSNYGKNLEQTSMYGICGEGLIIRHSSIAIIGLCPIGLASDGEYIIQAIYNGGNVKFCRICLFSRNSKNDDINSANKDRVKEDLIKIYKKYNISHITKNNTKFKKIIRFILKKYFPVYYGKRQAKFKVISECIINYDPALLNPESHLWDGGFS